MKTHAEILKFSYSFNGPTHLHTLYYPYRILAYTLYQLHLNRASSTCQIRIARYEPLRKEIYNWPILEQPLKIFEDNSGKFPVITIKINPNN